MHFSMLKKALLTSKTPILETLIINNQAYAVARPMRPLKYYKALNASNSDIVGKL